MSIIRDRFVQFFSISFFMLGVLFSQAAVSAEAVNLILKNNGSSAVEVALIDQYGGNFSANIDAGMASNQTLKNASEIRANGSVVHVVSDADEGKEVLISH